MTKLVGIVNITPDSFSDGGRYADIKSALAHMEKLWKEGADMLDIGAESTRPGATPISAEEEWERLSPLFSAITIADNLSLDTRHAINARRALDKGFGCINDVSGFTSSEMIDTVRGYNTQLIMMHSLGIPANKHITLPQEQDVIEALADFAKTQRDRLVNAGIAADRIIFDPGIGFGKTAAQSREILERVGELKNHAMPLYIGHSRKSFLGDDRDAATLTWSGKLMRAGVDYLRVHDIGSHVQLRKQLHG